MRKKISIIALGLILPAIVAAQAVSTNPCTGANPNLGRCVGQVYTWSLGVGGLLALFMIVFGGYRVLTAAGNAERASKGKSYIASSLIGLAILFGAYLILNQINPDLTQFNFDLSTYTKQQGSSSTSTAPRQ